VPEPIHPGFPGECFIGFPVVITDNHLYECWFKDRTDQERIEGPPAQRQIEARPKIRVYWHGSTVAPDYTSVDIVTAPELDRYATTMFRGCEELIELLQECLPLWAADVVSKEMGEFGRRLRLFEDDERQGEE
jgi:hypothetical protein